MAEPPTSQQDFLLPRLYAWLKGVESKVNTLLREVDLVKNDFLKKTNAVKHDVAVLTDDLLELKHEQNRLSQKMDLVIKELQRTAGKEELLTLQKYIDLWNPLHFATQRDVEKIVEEKLAERKPMRHSVHSVSSSLASHPALYHTASPPQPHRPASSHPASHETRHAPLPSSAHPAHLSAHSVHHTPHPSPSAAHKNPKKGLSKTKESKKHK